MARIVVVSGGGTGIGLATAQSFAADGDQVVLLGRREDVLVEAAESIPGARYCAADLSDPHSVRRATDFIAQQYGVVDVIVHSAGGNGVLEPQVEYDEPLETLVHDWIRNFQLNTLTAVLLTEALKDNLVTPGGRVLFLSSIAAYRGSGRVPYGASKAALHPYVFALARELGRDGITVNAVAPGHVDHTPFFGEPLTEERRQKRAAETATGRVGVPSDVVGTLRWLASEGAGHITGQVIQVNGGAQNSH